MDHNHGASSDPGKTIMLEQTQFQKTGGALIGRLEVGKQLNKATVISMVQKGWNLNGELEVLDVDKNVFIFQFSDHNDYFKVLSGRPWSIQAFLLNLQEWDNEMTYKEVCFDKCPFWIQFHGLSFSFLNRNNAQRLGSAIGDVMMVEDPVKDDKVVRNFLRARVLLDIRQPIPTGFWVPRKNKTAVWTETKYERIPTFCYKCGILGHEQRVCKVNQASKEEDDFDFGGWLKAFPPRSMEDLIVPINPSWCELNMTGAARRCKQRVCNATSNEGRNIRKGSPSGNTLSSHIAGGRTGFVVELSNEILDESKAIVPYSPSSPLAKVAEVLGAIKLKRSPPQIDSPLQPKRAKQDSSQQKSTTNSQMSNLRRSTKLKGSQVRRNIVHRTKRLLRRKLSFSSSISNSEGKLSTEHASQNITDEGAGGPQTALPAP